MNKLEIIAQLADFKTATYQSNLLLNCLIELLIEKNIITQQELTNKMIISDFISELEIAHNKRSPLTSDVC